MKQIFKINKEKQKVTFNIGDEIISKDGKCIIVHVDDAGVMAMVETGYMGMNIVYRGFENIELTGRHFSKVKDILNMIDDVIKETLQ